MFISQTSSEKSSEGEKFLSDRQGAPNASEPTFEKAGSDVKVFVSSLIGGMEGFRAAAVDAITSLGHEAITAENLAADPSSPKIACLSGVREANLIVLIMGAEYGSPQASGLSATHEEYREAKEGTRKRTLRSNAFTFRLNERGVKRHTLDPQASLTATSFGPCLTTGN